MTEGFRILSERPQKGLCIISKVQLIKNSKYPRLFDFFYTLITFPYKTRRRERIVDVCRETISYNSMSKMLKLERNHLRKFSLREVKQGVRTQHLPVTFRVFLTCESDVSSVGSTLTRQR